MSKLKGIYTDIVKIRRMVFAELARLALKDAECEEFDKIPYRIIDTEEATYRSSIFKERAIVAARVRMGLGMDYETNQEHKLLSEGIRDFLKNDNQLKEPLVNVIRFACEKCPTNAHFVTNNCRKCLAHPCSIVCPVDAITIEEHAAVIDQEKCINCGKCKEACPYEAIVNYERPCAAACGVDAIESDDYDRAKINQDKCVSCGQCIIACPFGAIADKSMIFQLLKSIKRGEDVRAIIAPSFVGQFGPLVSAEKIVAALKELGMKEVREVSLGADFASLHEAELFAEDIPEKQPYLGTSCCPSWTYVADKHVPEVKDNISESSSPMIFAAQSVKENNEDSKVVFIGPCVSKKLEALSDKVKEEVDFVITFEELAAIFVAADIELTKVDAEEEIRDASYYGRAYANAGGVAEAIRQNLKEKYQLDPQITKADGLADCKKTLLKAKAGVLDGHLIEGMACEGGCVGGPGTLLATKRGAKYVDKFADESPYKFAFENKKLNKKEKKE
ncbi:4Fe-4S dicluster domain-containing protein [Halanaerobium saccharolyticum]|uniref:4Fe-4S dicluster domain-containing protein n=1 Tax=Halanaerobium saccharolyticum TaxID=43595 RepID=UPI003FCD709D